MAFIGFGKIDKNIIPLILGCVFCLLNRILNSAFGNYLLSNVILTNIFISLANTLIIIPYLVYKLISKKIDKNKKKEDKDVNNEITKKESKNSNSTITDQEDDDKKLEYIYNENDDIENVPGKLKFIILIALIFFVNYYLFILTIDIKTNTWTMYIVFTSIFYYLIFKSKLYRHHYLCIGLILIFGIIIDIIEENLLKDANDKTASFCLSILRVILLSLIYVLIKYTMEKKYVSPYVLGMFIGLINLVLFIIFGILDHFFIHIYNNYIEYFQNFNASKLLVILGLMSTQLGLYTSLFFIDKNESPCHIFIVFVFGQFGYIFWNLRFIQDGRKIAGIIILLALILFFSLVFNEIIELRFLGFAYNTKRNITERGAIETDNTMLLNNNASDGRISNTIEMSDKDSNTEENN